MRDVNWGWMLRVMPYGLDELFFFFLVLLLHIFFAALIFVLQGPEMIWLLGVVIFLPVMAISWAVVLARGQMTRGAKVITGLFSAIPLVGEADQIWLLGGPPGNAALNRFFSLHFLCVCDCRGDYPAHLGATFPDRPADRGVKARTTPCRSTVLHGEG
jgi:ubiquinol-cytochrome c reductase cytochrome b subunit